MRVRSLALLLTSLVGFAGCTHDRECPGAGFARSGPAISIVLRDSSSRATICNATLVVQGPKSFTGVTVVDEPSSPPCLYEVAGDTGTYHVNISAPGYKDQTYDAEIGHDECGSLATQDPTLTMDHIP